MKRLRAKKLWTHCTDERPSLKAPAVGLGRKQPLTYEVAKENAKNRVANSPYMGLIFPKNSEYIGLDVDVDPTGEKKNTTTEVPIEVKMFLKSNPTHVHWSPSGYGLHIIYRIDDTVKEKLEELKLKQNATNVDKGDLFKGDWRYKSSFLTFTENEYELSTDKIAFITYDKLLDIIPSIAANSYDEDTEYKAGQVGSGSKGKRKKGKNRIQPSGPTKVPTINQLKGILEMIPPTFNEMAERACQHLPYAQPASNYDYWVLVGCACAHCAILLEGSGRIDDAGLVERLFLEWSKRDTEGFSNDDDVISKYGLLYNATVTKYNRDEPVTTVGSLALIARNCIIDFPDMLESKKGRLRPDPASMKNLITLMDFEQLELVFDPMGGGLCFKGSEETVTKWFCPTEDYLSHRPSGYSQIAAFADIAIRFRPFMQAKYNHSVTSQHAKEAIDFLSQAMRKENAFKRWIDSVAWDGEGRFQKVCKSIEIAEEERENKHVYESYIKRALLSMVGIHFWPEDAPKIPSMLVLSGAEYTYKSSWAEWLIPRDMGNYTATASVDIPISGGKDWLIFLATKAVIVINECEPMFTPRNEQKIKSSVDAETVTYRDLYAKQVLTRARTALIIGTTNKNNLFTGSTGTRKIWQIPVKECDSMLIRNMDLQQLYAEILHELKEFKKENPGKLIQEAWAQSEEDRATTNKLNARRKGVDVGVIGLLIEMFGHYLDHEFEAEEYVEQYKLVLRVGVPGDLTNNPNAWTVTAMLRLLRFHYPEDKLDRTSVKYAMEEYAAAYTMTTHRARRPFTKLLSDKEADKIITRGVLKISGAQAYYLMPEPRDPEDALKDSDNNVH